MNSLKQYFNFSRNDRIGAISILILIFLIFILPEYFVKTPESYPLKEDSALVNALIKLNNKQILDPNSKNNQRPNYGNLFSNPESQNFKKGELFNFDPNKLPYKGWRLLGLNDKKIQTILNYRNKGGKFYKPEDLQKIWGLPKGFYNRVKDFIEIAKQPDIFPNQKKLNYANNAKKITIVDINIADTAEFIALDGIGYKLATRIINFRNKLGGFYSIEQIRETYGLSDSTFQKIKPVLKVNSNELKLKKVNINTATKEELKAHPYIKWNMANAIVEYRNQHGPYLYVNDLKKIATITDDLFIHLEPYLTIQ